MIKRKGQIILIDDERNICLAITSSLEMEGYTVGSFQTAHEAMDEMRQKPFDMAIIDIKIGRNCGLKLYQQMLEEKLSMPVIFISGNASLSEAAASVHLGAYDFLEKPFSAEKLLVTVNNCLKQSVLQSKINEIENNSEQQIIGSSVEIERLRQQIMKVAPTDATVLISGKSGTGKELIAKSIHNQSKRNQQDFVVVNCSAIPENLIESALFGHVKGAFTGADSHKKGYFEVANYGTIFLDEIGDMPLNIQTKLLRILENKQIQKVGSESINQVDVRVIAASHKDLKDEVNKGTFREDLFYRLNIIPICSPPLSERKEDIPALVDHFLVKICRKYGYPKKSLSEECYATLINYDWPGNIRELLNTIERMAIMGGQNLTVKDIPSEILWSHETKSENSLTFKDYKAAMERKFLIEKLQYCNGNISKMAKLIDIDRTALHKKLNTLEIKRKTQIENE